MADDTKKLADRIPDPQEVRTRLAENEREAAFLRSLLRVAEKKPKPSAPLALSREKGGGAR